MQKFVTAKCVDCGGKTVLSGQLILKLDELFASSQNRALASGQLYLEGAEHHRKAQVEDGPQHNKYRVFDDGERLLGTLTATTQGADASFWIVDQSLRASLFSESRGSSIEGE